MRCHLTRWLRITIVMEMARRPSSEGIRCMVKRKGLHFGKTSVRAFEAESNQCASFVRILAQRCSSFRFLYWFPEFPTGRVLSLLPFADAFPDKIPQSGNSGP